MSSKKLEAKKAFLQKLAGKTRDEQYEGIGKALKGKKLQKVTVAAPDKEGLKKGLSLAEKLLKAKYGQDADMDEEKSEEEYESCPACDGEGCKACESEIEEEESDEE